MSGDPADFNQALRQRVARFSYLASMHLFDQGERSEEIASLAERMQPRVLGELIGAQQLQGLGEIVREAKQTGHLQPLLLWGPHGTGKTALARLIARECGLRIERLPATHEGAREQERVLAQSLAQRAQDGSITVLLIEAIDRCPKPLLGVVAEHLERGSIGLIGVTTENPWVTLPHALLEPLRVIELAPLSDPELIAVLERALRDRGCGLGELELYASRACLAQIASAARGDARRALDLLETAARRSAERGDGTVDEEHIAAALSGHSQRRPTGPDGHAGLERAFIGALRESDPDAALYWMIRMLQAGEVPGFVMRRMILFASEDVGNADPSALDLAVTTDQVLQRLGMPEALRSMGQCCVYLASAPKSDASYLALQAAERDAREHGTLPVPAGATSLLPDQLSDRKYYRPSERGYEARLRERLASRKR